MASGTSESRFAIDMAGISKRFAGVVANDAVNFDARFGEVHALIGENGAGKSTLMSVLAGLYRPDAGTIAINGHPVQFRSPRDSIAQGVGMVYQHFMLVDTFTVTENVLLGLEHQKSWLRPERVAGQLQVLSERFGLLVDPSARIWQLSVGEQQRVEILRLLFRGAKILVLDEPTAVLTPQESESLIRTLRQMAAEGFCIVFISHKLDEVLAVSDRVTVMRRGRVVETVATKTADRHSLARMMVGNELAAVIEHVDEGAVLVEPGPPALVLRGVSALNSRALSALSDIELVVREGEIVGIAGVAGNGQSELAEVVTGLRKITSGELVLGQKSMTNRSAGELAGAGVSHVPEDRLATGLVGSLEVTDNAILRTYKESPLSRGPFTIPRAIAAFADKLIREYDVKTPSRKARAGGLSGGNQQKLVIGRELSGRPRVLVAVHPTRGVDIGATKTIHTQLRDQQRQGTAILLISEDLDELMELANRVVVLYNGRIVGEIDPRAQGTHDIGLMMAGIVPTAASLPDSISTDA